MIDSGAVDPLVVAAEGRDPSVRAGRWLCLFALLITILGLTAGTLHWSMKGQRLEATVVGGGGLDGATQCNLDTEASGKIINIEAIVGQTYDWIRDNVLPSALLTSTINDATYLTLNTVMATAKCTPILSIPAGGLVINSPGCWRATQQFSFDEDDAAMITVLAQDVEVNLGGFLHRLGNGSVGVIVGNVSRTVIRHGGFLLLDGTYTDDIRSRGILAYGPQGCELRLLDLTFSGMLRAVDVYDLDNVHIDHCRFSQHRGFDGINVAPTNRAAPITLSGVTNGVITDVNIRDSILLQGEPMILSSWSIGARTSSLGTNVTNLRIDGVLIENAASISLYGATNVLIRGVLFTVTDDSYGGNFVETALGSTGVTLADSTLINTNANSAFDGVVITGTDVTVERVSIRLASAGHRQDGPLNTAGVHIGQALTNALYFTDNGTLEATGTFDAARVTVRDCSVTGVTPDNVVGTSAAIYIEPHCDGVVLERNNIRGVRGGAEPSDFSPFPLYAAGILVMGARSALIKDNYVYHSLDSPDGDEYQADGIGLRGELVLGNTTVPETEGCIVAENFVHGFRGYGIRNDGSGNVMTNNAAWDNTLGKYGGSGTYVPVVAALGDAAVEGANL